MAAGDLKPILFLRKKASLTGNTLEALQCVRLYQKAPDGEFRPLKVIIMALAKMFKLFVLYAGVYGGT